MLDEAVRQAVLWSGEHELDMAVNVSPRQLLDEGFPTFVARPRVTGETMMAPASL